MEIEFIWQFKNAFGKLEELEEIGICLNYIFLKTENKSNESFETHKKVAIASMNKIKEIMFNGIKNNLSKKKSKEITLENWPYFMIEIYEEKLLGEKINYEEFLENKAEDNKYFINGYKKAFFEPPTRPVAIWRQKPGIHPPLTAPRGPSTSTNPYKLLI